MPYVAAKERYDAMPYHRSGRSGLKLPAISLGLWHNFGGVDTLENARAMLRRAFDLGITHFDLANNYGPPPGSAEETFGRLLKQDFLLVARCVAEGGGYRTEYELFDVAKQERLLGFALTFSCQWLSCAKWNKPSASRTMGGQSDEMGVDVTLLPIPGNPVCG